MSKKYIISEDELKEVAEAANATAYRANKMLQWLTEYKEPQPEEPKFKEGDIVYYVEGNGVVKVCFVRDDKEDATCAWVLYPFATDERPAGKRTLFKNHDEAFDFLEKR